MYKSKIYYNNGTKVKKFEREIWKYIIVRFLYNMPSVI